MNHIKYCICVVGYDFLLLQVGIKASAETEFYYAELQMCSGTKGGLIPEAIRWEGNT